MVNKLAKSALLILTLAITGIIGCTTEFEKIRTSGDPDLIFKKANEYFKAERYLDAQSLYELSIQYFRGKTESEDIFYNMSYTHYYLGDYNTASQYFKNFTTSFFNSPKREDAYYMSAYSLYRLSPNYKLDQTPSSKAIEAFQEYINAYPDSPKIIEVNKLIDQMREKLDRKSYSKAQMYYRQKQYEAAVRSFQNHLKDYPGSKYEEEAQFLMIKSSFELASNSIIEKREERYNETMVLANKYLEKIAKRGYKNEVKGIVNDCKEKLKNLKI